MPDSTGSAADESTWPPQVYQFSRKVVPKAHHRSRPRRSVQPTILLPTRGPFLRLAGLLPTRGPTNDSRLIGQPPSRMPFSNSGCLPLAGVAPQTRGFFSAARSCSGPQSHLGWFMIRLGKLFRFDGFFSRRCPVRPNRGRGGDPEADSHFFEVPVACDRGKAGFGGAPCYRRTGLGKPEPVAQLSNGFPVPAADRASSAGGSNPVRNSPSDAPANSHSSPADSHHVPQAVAEHFVPQTSTDCSSPLSKSADAV
jgi:hypothetical protein